MELMLPRPQSPLLPKKTLQQGSAFKISKIWGLTAVTEILCWGVIPRDAQLQKKVKKFENRFSENLFGLLSTWLEE